MSERANDSKESRPEEKKKETGSPFRNSATHFRTVKCFESSDTSGPGDAFSGADTSPNHCRNSQGKKKTDFLFPLQNRLTGPANTRATRARERTEDERRIE